MVFLTDNYWVFDRLRRNATRMHVLSVRDLTPHETFDYLSGTHARHFPDEPPISKAQSLRIWDLIGGRLSYLSKAVKRRDVEGAARDLVAEETEWLHSHLGLIPDHDGQSWSPIPYELFTPDSLTARRRCHGRAKGLVMLIRRFPSPNSGARDCLASI